MQGLISENNLAMSCAFFNNILIKAFWIPKREISLPFHLLQLVNFSPFYKPEGRTEKGHAPVSRGASSHFSALTIKRTDLLLSQGGGENKHTPLSSKGPPAYT